MHENIPPPKIPLPALREFPRDDEFFPEIKDPRKRLFLRALASVPFDVLAEQLSGVSRMSHQRWSKPRYPKTFDPDYAKAAEIAREMGVDACEAEIGRRAFHGIDEDVYYKGKVVGRQKRYSDLLALAVMNARRPELYHRKPDNPEQNVTYNVNIIEYNEKQRVQSKTKGNEPIDVNPQDRKPSIKIQDW